MRVGGDFGACDWAKSLSFLAVVVGEVVVKSASISPSGVCSGWVVFLTATGDGGEKAMGESVSKLERLSKPAHDCDKSSIKLPSYEGLELLFRLWGNDLDWSPRLVEILISGELLDLIGRLDNWRDEGRPPVILASLSKLRWRCSWQVGHMCSTYKSTSSSWSGSTFCEMEVSGLSNLESAETVSE